MSVTGPLGLLLKKGPIVCVKLIHELLVIGS